MPDRITLAELEEKLLDIDVSDAELRQYFTKDRELVRRHSRPFQPSLQIDQSKVIVPEIDEPRTQAAVFGDFVNSVDRFRRRRRFRRAREDNPRDVVLVSEGDSWFQFPFLVEDTIDHLSRTYDIWCSGAAGDTLKNMILQNPEYLDAIDDVESRGDTVAGVLFSGGGNDVIGEDEDGSVLSRLVRQFDPTRSPAEHLIATEVDRQFEHIAQCYDRLRRDIRVDHPDLPIFLHGYGYVFPGKFDANDRRDPFYAGPDQWIGAPLRAKGFHDTAFQRQIVTLLLNRFHDLLAGFAAADAKVFVVDVREAVPEITGWKDEIHPTDQGFGSVANVFRGIIDQALAA